MTIRMLIVVAVCCSGVWPQTPSLLDSVTRALEFAPGRASSANEDLAKNGDARPIPAGGELVLADLEDPAS